MYWRKEKITRKRQANALNSNKVSNVTMQPIWKLYNVYKVLPMQKIDPQVTECAIRSSDAVTRRKSHLDSYPLLDVEAKLTNSNA